MAEDGNVVEEGELAKEGNFAEEGDLATRATSPRTVFFDEEGESTLPQRANLPGMLICH